MWLRQVASICQMFARLKKRGLPRRMRPPELGSLLLVATHGGIKGKGFTLPL